MHLFAFKETVGSHLKIIFSSKATVVSPKKPSLGKKLSNVLMSFALQIAFGHVIISHSVYVFNFLSDAIKLRTFSPYFVYFTM